MLDSVLTQREALERQLAQREAQVRSKCRILGCSAQKQLHVWTYARLCIATFAAPPRTLHRQRPHPCTPAPPL
jgi:hypothetical protein